MEHQESKWDRKYLRIFTLKSILGTLIGLIGGYIYYREIGCSSGSCPITSNPYLSLFWGGLMGYLLGGMFEKNPKKK
jgi:hypothetical protein